MKSVGSKMPISARTAHLLLILLDAISLKL